MGVRGRAERRHLEVLRRLDAIEQTQQQNRALDVLEALVDVLKGLQRTLDRLDSVPID